MAILEMGGLSRDSLRDSFIARHRAENDRYIPRAESLALFEDFVRNTGPTIIDGPVVPVQHRGPVLSEVRCRYCSALGRTDRCTNCGAGRGC